jgi:hypothetical protein
MTKDEIDADRKTIAAATYGRRIEMEIKPGFYKTRDGRKVRVLCVDAPGDFPVMGYYEIPNPTVHHYGMWNWRQNGTNNDFDAYMDLVTPWREPIRGEGWIDTYTCINNQGFFVYKNPEQRFTVKIRYEEIPEAMDR